jgi:hypothetical protein
MSRESPSVTQIAADGQTKVGKRKLAMLRAQRTPRDIALKEDIVLV